MTKGEQSGHLSLISHIFQDEEVINRIEAGEKLKTKDSLEGWAKFARLKLPNSGKFLNNPETARVIYEMFEC